MAIKFTETYHRNGVIRNVSYDGEKINDGLNVYSGNYNAFKNVCEDMKRQGFRWLPYDPTDVVMTENQKSAFTKRYGYEF